jgi:Tol biopolymer transport system component
MTIPELSPDELWIAYTVTSVDKDEDKRDSNIWMVSWDGAQDIQVTYSPESEGSPHWSPDGKYLAFTSSRPGHSDICFCIQGGQDSQVH